MAGSGDEAPGEANRKVIDEFRANGGVVGGAFTGAPMVLLTTTGARSGRPHTTPAIYLRDGDRIVVFASNAGGPSHPAWFHNLRADPRVTVEIGSDDGSVESYTASAEVLEGDERARLYARQARVFPRFAEYESMTTRTIPVVALTRMDFGDPERNRAVAEQLRQVHDQLRSDLSSVRSAVAEYASDAPPEAPPPTLNARLHEHCLSFCNALGLHHTGEDGAFASLEAQFPELGPAIHRLRAEHGRVAEVLAELRALLTQLASGGATETKSLSDDLAKLSSDLEAHFAYEEAQLLPVLERG